MPNYFLTDMHKKFQYILNRRKTEMPSVSGNQSMARLNATRAAEAAWLEHDRLVDQYTAIGDQYSDYFAPPVEAARAAVIAAAHEAQRLQQIADELNR